MSKLWRVDPKGCKCTGCLIGESKAIDLCTQEELFALYTATLQNASGSKVVIRLEVVDA